MTFTSWRQPLTSYSPGVNIFEKDSEILLEVELPGRKREDVNVEVVDRTLKISAKEAVTDREGFEASYVERSRGAIERSFRLGADLEPGKVQARFENGLLLLSIPKQATAQPHKVEIL
jgi:HSP20 family protein